MNIDRSCENLFICSWLFINNYHWLLHEMHNLDLIKLLGIEKSNYKLRDCKCELDHKAIF